MPARLFCKTGEMAGAEYRIDSEAVIGRDNESGITLRPNLISGRHARIYFDSEAGAYFLEDLGSSNGTELDGTAVTEPRRLGPLHVVTLAREFDFIFQVLSAETSRPKSKPIAEKTSPIGAGEKTVASETPVKPAEAGERTVLGDEFGAMPGLGGAPASDDSGTRLGSDFGAMPHIPDQASTRPSEEKTRFVDDFAAMPPIQKPAPQASPRYALQVKLPGGLEQEFDLKEGRTVVGRLDENDITLQDSSVSRRHAQLEVRAGKVTVSDLGTKNFTFVDGSRVAGEVEVAVGSVIRFGPSVQATLIRK